jgi:hypothetical protein
LGTKAPSTLIVFSEGISSLQVTSEVFLDAEDDDEATSALKRKCMPEKTGARQSRGSEISQLPANGYSEWLQM